MEAQIDAKILEITTKFEQEVVAGLNILEDFVFAIKDTTDGQYDEVNQLKEKVLSYFTQLEYARSLGERNRDPGYIQLLKSQPLDPSSVHKFHAIEKIFR
jgi:hypothetical protein